MNRCFPLTESNNSIVFSCRVFLPQWQFSEIHAAHLINRPGELVSIKRNDRLSIIRFFAKEIGSLGDLSIINVVVDKQGKAADYDVCTNAWRALIQRFSNTMRHRNFFGPRECGRQRTLGPALCRVASQGDTHGIVRL